MSRKKQYNLNKKVLKVVGSGLTNLVLGIVSVLDDAYTEAIFDTYHRGPRYRSDLKPASKPLIYSTLNRLKKQGLVQVRKKDNRVYYQVTVSGQTKLLVNQVFANKKRRTDGFSTIIIFDIPEERRKARVYLRKLLLKNGFMNLQKSVLISPNELPKSFFRLLEELKVRRFVTVLSSRVIYS